jgi:hypothetical protein
MTPTLSMRRSGAEGEQVRERKRAERMTEDSKRPVLRLRDQPQRVGEDRRTRRATPMTATRGSSPGMRRSVLMRRGKNKTCTESRGRSRRRWGMVNRGCRHRTALRPVCDGQFAKSELRRLRIRRDLLP